MGQASRNLLAQVGAPLIDFDHELELRSDDDEFQNPPGPASRTGASSAEPSSEQGAGLQSAS